MEKSQKKATETKPYHEIVKEDIVRASAVGELVLIASQLKRITIPLGEIDGVIAQWNKKCKELGLGDIDLGVTPNLLRQKQVAEAKRQLG